MFDLKFHYLRSLGISPDKAAEIAVNSITVPDYFRKHYEENPIVSLIIEDINDAEKKD